MSHRAPIAHGLALLAALALAGCSPLASASSAPTPCPAAAETAPSASDGEPDLTLYGFPTVAAATRFLPGQKATLEHGAIAVTIPPDLYTEPLEFELLTGDEQRWQSCVPPDQVVIAPYAYRVTETATGRRIGRFDRPVVVSISDARISSPATYWITSASTPPTVRPSSSTPQVDGDSIRVQNNNARVGWFTTSPAGGANGPR